MLLKRMFKWLNLKVCWIEHYDIGLLNYCIIYHTKNYVLQNILIRRDTKVCIENHPENIHKNKL